ncbi:MAG: hypothetical protein N3A65_02585 [candidate division WOR-3 bacterium]|nr:hypothetical protein [candidate division WOR-3 bacterium]
MKVIEEKDVKWHSGKDNKTYPRCVKVDGVWREVFSFEKKIFEEFPTRKRYIIFLCHIGDNEIVKVKCIEY